MRADGNPYKDYCEDCGGNGYTGCVTEPEWCECLDTDDFLWSSSPVEVVGQPHGFFEPLSPNMLMLRATVIFAIAMGLIVAGIAAL